MTITEFLLARIAEDEAAVRLDEWGGLLALDRFNDNPLQRWDYDQMLIGPRRVLAECEAKRRIVELHHPSGEYERDACVLCQWDIDCEMPRADYKDGAGEFPCDTLRHLASVYAGHPDYDAQWRP